MLGLGLTAELPELLQGIAGRQQRAAAHSVGQQQQAAPEQRLQQPPALRQHPGGGGKHSSAALPALTPQHPFGHLVPPRPLPAMFLHPGAPPLPAPLTTAACGRRDDVT